MTDKTLEKDRISEMIDAIMKVGSGDYSVQVELSGKNDEFDSLAMGLNMMIDDVRTSEEALRESEEKYKTLVENATDFIYMIDADDRILSLNKSGANLFGKEPRELTGRTIFDVFPKEIATQFSEGLRQVFKTGMTRKAESKMIAGENEMWISASLSPIRNDNNEVVAVMGVTRDVTERKRAEHDLKERVKELNCLYGVAEIAQKPEMTFDEIYQGVANLLPESWQYPEITGARIIVDDKKFKTENYRETEWKQSSDIMVHGAKAGVVEVSYLEERPELNEGPFLKEERLLIDAVAERLGRITERKRMEEALRQSEENLRTYLENAPDGVYLNDLKGKFLYGNKKAEEIAGCEKEELIGGSFLKLNILPKKYLAKAGKLLALNTMGRPTGPDEFELIRKDGSRVWVEITTTPIKQRGKVVVIGFVRDITERKKAQQELQEKNEQLDAQNEELRVQGEELQAQQQELVKKTEEVTRANQLKSEFLANMSHELRTPLNVIIGFSQLMVDEVPGKINQEQKQCLSDTLDSSQQLLNLINEVLDLSKIESGKTELKQEKVILTEVIASLTRSMTPILTQRQQSLDVEIEEGLPPVYTDKDKLGQALLNLVDNASKFTPDGGKLKIEAVSDDGWCRVSVIDDGIGIKEEDQERIFEPFCQLENPLTKGESGTGLGLALVKQIVKRYGGRIWVESKYGKGSRFTFTLPLATNTIPPEERNRQ